MSEGHKHILGERLNEILGLVALELKRHFPVARVVLFGSYARGDWDSESDIDILILTSRPMPRPERHLITDYIWEVNLKYGTNFTTLVVEQEAWDKGRLRSLPLRGTILKEGVAL